MFMVRATWAGTKLLLTWVAAHIVYGYFAVEYPTQTRQSTKVARGVLDYLETLHIPDQYMVWGDLLLQPAVLVILFIAVLLRILLSILVTMVKGAFHQE